MFGFKFANPRAPHRHDLVGELAPLHGRPIWVLRQEFTIDIRIVFFAVYRFWFVGGPHDQPSIRCEPVRRFAGSGEEEVVTGKHEVLREIRDLRYHSSDCVGIECRAVAGVGKELTSIDCHTYK